MAVSTGSRTRRYRMAEEHSRRRSPSLVEPIREPISRTRATSMATTLPAI
jgi:hypothetical protein